MYAMLLLQKLANFSDVGEVVVVTSSWHAPRARVAFELFVPSHLKLRMDSADDDGSEERTRKDLALLPATWRDVEAVSAPFVRPLSWAVVARLVGKGPVLVSADAPALEGATKCDVTSKQKARVALMGLVVSDLTACRIAPVVFVETHEQLAAKLRGVNATKIVPLSSTTWVYQLQCATKFEGKRDVTSFGCVVL
jgi:hypothetical protein